MRLALLSLLLVACAHSHSEEARSEAHSDVTSQATQQVETTTTRSEGPERVVTTTEEYGAPQEAATETPAGGLPAVQAAQRRSGQEGAAAGGAPATPVLIRRVVRVEERGQVTQQTVVNAQAASQTHAAAETHAEAKESSKTSWWPPWWLYVVAAGIAYTAWRLRKAWPV